MDPKEILKEDIEYYTHFIKENYEGRNMSLEEVEDHIPEMKKLGVSSVARSKQGFIQAYRDAKGKLEDLPDEWKLKRLLFIRRSYPQYMAKQYTRRRGLSLIAWAYLPEKELPEFKRKLRRKQGERKVVKKEKPEEKEEEKKEEKKE